MADEGQAQAGMARTERVYFAALERPEGERARFIAEACGSDEALRSDVMELLAAGAACGGFLEQPVAMPEDAALSAARILVGRQVGGFTLREVIGEGGMGVVFRAEQSQPKREVALKLVRPGLASPSMLRRFELEAEALGRLRHPGIAAIHAAGTEDLGLGPQPYFAMELVQGVPLHDYLASRRPSLEERVQLLAAVAWAVQHAHQNGVIHRDLKPDNILVEEEMRGEPRPRVLDFGVARLLDPGSVGSRGSGATEAGQVVGTLHYMAPEQVGSGEVDTRSDVYALGLIAWEAMAGRQARQLPSDRFVDAIRFVAERDPPSLASVCSEVPPDLSVVIGKALEREPSRRYAAAGEFAADLERFLRHEPVTAQPPTKTYLLRRFARRHRTLVAAVSIVAVTVLAALIVSIALLGRTERARASEAQRAIDSSAIADYMLWTLGLDANKPGETPIDPETVRGFLRQLEQGVDRRLAGMPQAQVRVLNSVGERLNLLTDYEESRRVFERSLAICAESLPTRHLLRASALHGLAAAEWFLGLRDRPTMLRSRQHYEEALALRKAILGAEHSDTALTMRHLAAALRSLGEGDEAERLYRESLEVHERLHAMGDPLADAAMVASGLNGLAALLAGRSEFDEAEQLYERALTLLGSMPTAERRVVDEARVLRNRGVTRSNLGRFDTAAEDLQRAEEIFRQQLGERHREVATTTLRQAQLAVKSNQPERAAALARAVIDRFGLAPTDSLVRDAAAIVNAE